MGFAGWCRSRESRRAAVLAAFVVAAFGFAGESAARPADHVTTAVAPALKPPTGPVPVTSLLPAAPQWCAGTGVDALPDRVNLCWVDSSTNETEFVVYKRSLVTGAFQAIYQSPTRNGPGVGDGYSWSDIDVHYEASQRCWSGACALDPDPGAATDGWCYMVAAVDQLGPRDSTEQCTVRPNPEWFPQAAYPVVKQWNGLSDVNGGTGDLHNRPRGGSLIHTDKTFGVDLDFSSKPALWKIQAQGGSKQVMYGQAVALRVWGGGWLTYDPNEETGVTLGLSQTPSYEWFVIGGQPGTPIDSRPAYQAPEFALWNSRTKTYLITKYQPYGVNLAWYTPKPQFGLVGTVSMYMNALPPVGNNHAYSGTFNDSDYSAVVTNVFGSDGVTFIPGGSTSSDCQTPNTSATLQPGDAGLGIGGMQTVWGTTTPSLIDPLPFFACYTSASAYVNYAAPLVVLVQYIDQN